MRIDHGVLRTFALSTAAGAATLALLTACGGDTAGSAHGHGGTSATPAATAGTGTQGGFNQADAAFAQQMIPHHRQAVEMAELAESRAAAPQIKELAREIKAAQDPEITTMRGWLSAWGAAEAPAHAGHAGHGAAGMMSDEDMAELKAARGREFDRLFAEMMIEHHAGAIEMAQTQVAQGSDPEAQNLAQAIIDTQQREIDQMKRLLKRL